MDYFRRDAFLYHKFDNMLIRSGIVYLICSPGNPDNHKIVHFVFLFHHNKVEIGDQRSIIKNISA